MLTSVSVYHVETPICHSYPRGVAPEIDVEIKKHHIPTVVIWMFKVVIQCEVL